MVSRGKESIVPLPIVPSSASAWLSSQSVQISLPSGNTSWLNLCLLDGLDATLSFCLCIIFLVLNTMHLVGLQVPTCSVCESMLPSLGLGKLVSGGLLNCMGFEWEDGEQTRRSEKARDGSDGGFAGSLGPSTGARRHVSLWKGGLSPW